MGKINEVMSVSHLGDDDFINVILADGTIGKIMKTDLLPIISPIENIGLIDRSKFALHDTYNTRSITYRALKITTDISVEGFKTIMFDICIMSYNYSGIISFALKVHIDKSITRAWVFNKNLDGIESIYAHNENGKLCFTISFTPINLNISNGVISALCYAVLPGKVDYTNTIISINETEKYTSGTNINEVKVPI